MIHTDRKPGVKLVTDPPKREPMLTLRIREADADALLAPQSSVKAIRARKAAIEAICEAVRRAKQPRMVNL